MYKKTRSIPLDAFIHDFETLEYFFQKVERETYILGLPSMIAEGIIIKGGKEAEQLQKRSMLMLQSKPSISTADLDSRRFFISDCLEDLQDPKNEHEKLATIFHLYALLAQFYLLTSGHWMGSSKQLARLLNKADPIIAKKFELAFSYPYDVNKLHNLALEILEPHGGLLWNGFRSDQPNECRAKQ